MPVIGARDVFVTEPVTVTGLPGVTYPGRIDVIASETGRVPPGCRAAPAAPAVAGLAAAGPAAASAMAAGAMAAAMAMVAAVLAGRLTCAPNACAPNACAPNACAPNAGRPAVAAPGLARRGGLRRRAAWLAPGLAGSRRGTGGARRKCYCRRPGSRGRSERGRLRPAGQPRRRAGNIAARGLRTSFERPSRVPPGSPGFPSLRAGPTLNARV